MSFVTKTTEEQAGPELKPLYEAIRSHFGFVPNYFQAQGRFPDEIRKHLEHGEVVMRDGALPQLLKEQILLVVSGINSSSYCIVVHMENLHRLGVEQSLCRYLATDYTRAPVGEKEMALFRFADKLTREPLKVEKADAEAVFKAGWDERALVEAVLVIAWTNFINRVAFGLGLVGEHFGED